MQKHLCTILCLVFTAILIGSSAQAIPSFRGYTGLLIVPTADALGKGDWNAGVFWEDVSSGTINSYVANYGFAQDVEIGFDKFRLNDNSLSKTLLNAKWAFRTETYRQPGVAAGIIDITNDLETTVYVVASKSLTASLGTYNGEIITPRIHVGFGGGGFDGLFVAISTYLGNSIQLIAEWDSNNVQLCGRLRLTPSFTAHAGWFNVGDKDNLRSPFARSSDTSRGVQTVSA